MPEALSDITQSTEMPLIGRSMATSGTPASSSGWR